MNDVKQQLLDWIERDRESLIEFLRAFLRCKTPNPPGDVTAGAQFVQDFLQSRDARFKIITPRRESPNILSAISFPQAGRHLVLNGHMDVLPIGSESEWRHDPWGGEMVDGRIYGRGAVDMKCGLTASIFTYVYLSRLKEHLRGKLTLSIASEGERSGQSGNEYLMEHHLAEVLGDCCLTGEPGGPMLTAFGGKGRLCLRVKVATPGGDGAYVHTSKNAIAIALAILSELMQLTRLPVADPPALKSALHEAADALDRARGHGTSQTVRSVTVNIGEIKGGARADMIASDCEFNLDLRVPNGMSLDEVLARAEAMIARYSEAGCVVIGRDEPNWCNPDADMYAFVERNAQRITGIRPTKVISASASDARLWRMRDVPAVSYGPSAATMGKPDEHVTVDELMAVMKTHALSAYDYLTAAG